MIETPSKGKEVTQKEYGEIMKKKIEKCVKCMAAAEADVEVEAEEDDIF